jgi:hypothetical protein
LEYPYQGILELCCSSKNIHLCAFGAKNKFFYFIFIEKFRKT